MPEASWGQLFGLGGQPEPAQEPLQVYVAARPFSEFGGDLMKRLPGNAKSLLVDIGVCHYMVILLDPTSGQLSMFDFGPVGGDVHMGVSAGKRKSKSVPGEVRLTHPASLPEASMHLGCTHMTLEEVEEFNKMRNVQYELNINDCRHYANQLVHLTTGVSNATTRLVHHQFMHRRSHNLTPVDRLVPPVQCLTNPDNWHRVRQSLHAVGFATLYAVGHPVILPPLASTSAVAASALQALVASSPAQRVMLASSTLAQQALLHPRALVSPLKFGMRHTSKGAVAKESSKLQRCAAGLSGLGRAVSVSVSHGIVRMHRSVALWALRRRNGFASRQDPLWPLRSRLSSHLACLTAVPLALGTAWKEKEAVAVVEEQGVAKEKLCRLAKRGVPRARPLLAASNSSKFSRAFPRMSNAPQCVVSVASDR